MKKTIIILLTSLAIFIATVESTMQYAHNSIAAEVDSLNNQTVLLLEYQLHERLTWSDHGEVKNPDRLRGFLNRILPYDSTKTAVIITDTARNIILATDPYYENPENRVAMHRTFERRELIPNTIAKNVKHYSAETDNDGTYHIYSIRMHQVPWYVVLVCSDREISEHVQSLSRILYIICGTGFCLILLCTAFIYRQTTATTKKRAALEKELSMAAEVQQQLLPPPHLITDHTTIEAYLKPARMVGGDLYDYVSMPDGTIVFCIGDVSGKGMPAALFMSQVISLFHNATLFTTEPSEIVSQINKVLCINNSAMTFCTFIVGTISKQAIAICNAGHTPPLLTTTTNNTTATNNSAHTTTFLSLTPHLAMGLNPSYTYHTQFFPFPPGSSLLLYTDGVTEARNPSRQQYGTTRLLSTIISNPTNPSTASNSQPTSIISSLLHNPNSGLFSFTDGAPQSDDITLLSITQH